MTVGEKLKTLRKKKGLTTQKLAHYAGISLRALARYENGQSYPRKGETYERLTDVLDCPADYLISEYEIFHHRPKSDREEISDSTSTIVRAMIGGVLSDEELDQIMKEITYAYWEGKKI